MLSSVEHEKKFYNLRARLTSNIWTARQDQTVSIKQGSEMKEQSGR